MKTWILTLLFCFVVTAVHSQDSANQSSILKEFGEQDSIDNANKLSKSLEGDVKLVEIRTQLEIKKSEYLISSLDHRAKVFHWQYVASVIIFTLVMIIVISGLVLSYLHFYKDLKSPTGSTGTEMELTLSGLKINSSIIGLVILVISIAFLYMYLIYVFPINELNVDAAVSK